MTQQEVSCVQQCGGWWWLWHVTEEAGPINKASLSKGWGRKASAAGRVTGYGRRDAVSYTPTPRERDAGTPLKILIMKKYKCISVIVNVACVVVFL